MRSRASRPRRCTTMPWARPSCAARSASGRAFLISQAFDPEIPSSLKVLGDAVTVLVGPGPNGLSLHVKTMPLLHLLVGRDSEDETSFTGSPCMSWAYDITR